MLIFTAFLLFMVAVALGYTDRIRWKWLVTAGAMTYPLYLVHYAAGTALINRLHDTMDARLLVAAVIAGFLVLSYLVHRCVERPVSRLLKKGLDTSFARLRNAGATDRWSTRRAFSPDRRADLVAECRVERVVRTGDVRQPVREVSRRPACLVSAVQPSASSDQPVTLGDR